MSSTFDSSLPVGGITGKSMSHSYSIHPNGVQAILFDLDGTLRYNCPRSEDVFLDYLVSLGAPDSINQRKAALRWTHYYWAQSAEFLEDFERFKSLDADFWLNYSRRKLAVFGCSPEQVEAWAEPVAVYMKAEHAPTDWVPPEVPATLEALKTAGFRLGVLSNRNQPCQDHLTTLALADYFELMMVAGEVACWKPDPVIFQHALDRLGVSPDQAVYVGDNYYADIIGAKAAGMHPVLIDPDGIFPDADCPVITAMDGLPDVLARSPWDASAP